MFGALPRRRRVGLPVGRFEALESRALLSAAVPEILLLPPVSAEVGSFEPGVPHGRAKAAGPLTGSWDLDTDGTIYQIETTQKGNKIKGTISQANNPLIQDIKVKGKASAEGEFSLSFKGKINFPLLGKLRYTGEIDGQYELENSLITGVIKVQVNGETATDAMFEADLPAAPVGLSTPATGRAKETGPLTGNFEIETQYGVISGEIVQTGNKIKGTGNYAPFELTGIKFKGKVTDDGEFLAKFKGKVKDVPDRGTVRYNGVVEGQYDLETESVAGTVQLNVKGEELGLQFDFEGDLPQLPPSSSVPTLSSPRKAVPRIGNFAGEYPTSGNLGTGTMTVTQDGWYVNGEFDTDVVDEAIFDAVFTNNRSTKAKGVIQIYFADEPDVRYAGKFWVKFLGGDSWTSKYGKLTVVTNG